MSINTSGFRAFSIANPFVRHWMETGNCNLPHRDRRGCRQVRLTVSLLGPFVTVRCTKLVALPLKKSLRRGGCNICQAYRSELRDSNVNGRNLRRPHAQIPQQFLSDCNSPFSFLTPNLMQELADNCATV